MMLAIVTNLDFIGIADDDFVEQNVAACVIVAIDESRHDRHLHGIEGPRTFALAIKAFGFRCASQQRRTVRL